MRSGTPAHVRHERLCYVFPVTVCTCKIRGSGEMGLGGGEGMRGGGVGAGDNTGDKGKNGEDLPGKRLHNNFKR